MKLKKAICYTGKIRGFRGDVATFHERFEIPDRFYTVFVYLFERQGDKDRFTEGVGKKRD